MGYRWFCGLGVWWPGVTQQGARTAKAQFYQPPPRRALCRLHDPELRLPLRGQAGPARRIDHKYAAGTQCMPGSADAPGQPAWRCSHGDAAMLDMHDRTGEQVHIKTLAGGQPDGSGNGFG